MDKEKFMDSFRGKLMALIVALAAFVTFLAGVVPELGLPTVIDIDVVTPFINVTVIVVGALIFGWSVRNTKVSTRALRENGGLDREKLIESFRVKLTAILEVVFGLITLFAGVFPNAGLPAVIDMNVAEPFVYVVAVIAAVYIVARSHRNVKEPV